MELKEYLKEIIEKVDKKEDDGGMLVIYINDELMFKYHDECYVDFQDDFCILYDKVTETNMVIPYDKIATMQYMNKEIIEKQKEEMDIGKVLRRLMED